MNSNNKCIIVGAGLSGLVTAKELIEVGIDDVVLLDKGEDLGGIWQTHCWPNATLTSSKWITEFGSFPMPDGYPDFPTPEQMVDYLRAFAEQYDLTRRIHCGIAVQAIQCNESGTYNVVTANETYENCTYVIVCSGLHGKPSMPNIPGIDGFSGTLTHGQSYCSPAPFRDKRVVCIGLGESAVGITSEISTVASQTVVAGSSFAAAPRVYPYTTIPIDQFSFWQLGKLMKDYQELVTLGASWYGRLPTAFRSTFAQLQPALKLFPEAWIPQTWAPNRWLAKYWPHPGTTAESNASGNLTRPKAPTDDLLHLYRTQQIEPKGRVIRVEGDRVYFQDGSYTDADALVFNTGYKASPLFIQFPNDWTYRHQDLYKGCFHPSLPNVAFVGLVRPTIGSIPAMAEMQARWVAQVFSGAKLLPNGDRLQERIEKDAERHARKYATVHDRFPHVYAFEEWMEEMAILIGCQPKLKDQLGSWRQLQAHLMGGTQPIRYRYNGPGKIEGAKKKYVERVNRLFANRLGRIYRNYILVFFFYPHILTLFVGLGCFEAGNCSVPASLGIAALFWLMYMSVDIFRFLMWIPLIALDGLLLRRAFEQEKALDHSEVPNYSKPEVFQT